MRAEEGTATQPPLPSRLSLMAHTQHAVVSVRFHQLGKDGVTTAELPALVPLVPGNEHRSLFSYSCTQTFVAPIE